jgi:hypothetical protein
MTVPFAFYIVRFSWVVFPYDAYLACISQQGQVTRRTCYCQRWGDFDTVGMRVAIVAPLHDPDYVFRVD